MIVPTEMTHFWSVLPSRAASRVPMTSTFFTPQVPCNFSAPDLGTVCSRIFFPSTQPVGVDTPDDEDVGGLRHERRRVHWGKHRNGADDRRSEKDQQAGEGS